MSLGLILIILPNLSGGGAELIHVNLANDWVAKGYEVRFILLRKKGELLFLLSNKIEIIDLNVNRIRQAIIPLALILYRLRPDVTIAAMWPLTSIAVCSWLISGFKGKLYLSEHENLSASYIEQRRVNILYLKYSIRFTYPFATGIVAVSNGVKKDLCILGNLSNDYIKVIYNPVSSGIRTNINNKKRYSELWGKDDDYRILAVGRLTIQKDHETLIRAFALLPNSLSASLIILGEGSQRNEIIKLINSLGLGCRISLPGFVVDPKPWFLSADLFVLSSRWEGFGNVIVEALECGLPVVSTDCPSGPNEILEGGKYGTLIPVGDSFLLAKAILSNQHKLHDYEILIDRALEFSIPKISNDYIKYFFK